MVTIIQKHVDTYIDKSGHVSLYGIMWHYVTMSHGATLPAPHRPLRQLGLLRDLVLLIYTNKLLFFQF